MQTEYTCPTCGIAFTDKSGRERRYCSLRCYRISGAMGPAPIPLATRFWSKVDRSAGPDGCWLWTGNKDSLGYGRILIVGRRQDSAHRVAWGLTNGPIPDGLWVLHNCPGGDTPACCNPSHLWLGTHKDNMADMVAKGRHGTWTHPESRACGSRHNSRTRPETVLRGERIAQSKLTEVDVRAIRAEYAAGGVTQAALATKYGIVASAIGSIIRRVRWAHVGDGGGNG